MKEHETPSQVGKKRNVNRMKLLMLWLIPLGLMAIAWLCYYLVQQGYINLSSTNKGEFIQPPVQMNELFANGFQSRDGKIKSNWNGKWTIVIRGDANCQSSCRENLHLSRQIHIRLDKNADRVQRVFLSGSQPLSDELQSHISAEHIYLKMATADTAALSELDAVLTSATGESAKFFIVDPKGWAMMFYLNQHEGNAVLKDLKYLLKYSRES